MCAGLNFWNANSGCVAVDYMPSGARPVNCWAHKASGGSGTLTNTNRGATAVLVQ
jgi:hypothetical protein